MSMALYDAFKARAEAVNAEVHRFALRGDALRFILTILAEEPGSTAVWVNGTVLDGIDQRLFMQQVPGLSFEVTRDAAEQARIGISQVEAAIADTGTLITDAGPVERRLASALPSINIAIAATESIEPDMAAAFARLHPSRCGYISMITGPSRTADIERVLTIGVHGPARLLVVFVDELGRN